MPKRYYSLLILSILYISFVAFFKTIETPPSKEKASPSTDKNGEALLAMGKRISLCHTTPIDLQLIKGISDTFSERITLKRSDILKKSKTLSNEDQYLALTLVKGIGEKTAKKISRYLETTDCKKNNE